MSGQAPADVMAAFEADQSTLGAAGIPSGIAHCPSPFPEAELLDVDGAVVSARAALAGRVTVVVFYRGDWCPYCNIALRAYRRLVPELSARGVALLCVSPQRPDGSPPADGDTEVPLTVVSDPGCQLADALGIMTTPGDPVLSAQRQLGLDLREVNADGTAAIPMPTVALVDASGVLRWIDVHPDYTTRTEPAHIMAAVDVLLAAES